jgi:DNA-binding NarL/FixJ family response regulator
MSIDFATPGVAQDGLRVLVAAPTGRERLRYRLQLSTEHGFDVVAEAVEAQQAVAVAAFERPDVIVLSAALPNDQHIDVVHELARICPNATIVMSPGGTFDLRAELRQNDLSRRPQ